MPLFVLVIYLHISKLIHSSLHLVDLALLSLHFLRQLSSEVSVIIIRTDELGILVQSLHCIL